MSELNATNFRYYAGAFAAAAIDVLVFTTAVTALGYLAMLDPFITASIFALTYAPSFIRHLFSNTSNSFTHIPRKDSMKTDGFSDGFAATSWLGYLSSPFQKANAPRWDFYIPRVFFKGLNNN